MMSQPCSPTLQSLTLLRIIRERLASDATLSDRTTLSVDSIMELLTFCVNTTYFMFQGDIFREENGAAMVSPVSPLVANLYMEWFEQYALHTFPSSPSFWASYVDDTYVVIEEKRIDAFTTHINNISPSINGWQLAKMKKSIPDMSLP